MRAKRFLILLFILVSVVTLVACSAGKSDFKLELVDENQEFVYDYGEVDLSNIQLNVYDRDGNLTETVSVTLDMITEGDRAKLETPGTKTIAVYYNNTKIHITVTINAVEEIPTYHVTFDAQGGVLEAEEGSPEIYTYGNLTEIREIPVPVKDGYVFEGWYESRTYTGQKIIAPYKLVRNMTVYAKWSDARRYTVQYVRYLDGKNEGNIASTQNIEHGTTIDLLAPESFDSANFAGYEIWNADESYSEAISLKIPANSENFKITVDNNKMVRINYSTKVLTLTYKSEVWDIDRTYQINYGNSLETDAFVLPEKPGHTGVWRDFKTSKAPQYNYITEDMTIVAEYSAITYVVKFFYKANLTDTEYTLDQTREALYNTRILNVPSTPVKTGYTGTWKIYDEEKNLVDVTLTDPIMSDMDVYADYSINSYKVRFNFSLREKADSNITQNIVTEYVHVYNTKLEIPEDLTTDRLTVDGVECVGYDAKYYTVEWYTNPSMDKNARVSISATTPYVIPASDTNFYAKIIVNPYKIDFMIPVGGEQGSFVYEIVSYYVDATLPAYERKLTPPEVILEKYNVTGWIAELGGGQYDIFEYETALDGKMNIYDFREYNEDPSKNFAFKPEVEIKTFNIEFRNLVITGASGSYVRDYVTCYSMSDVAYGDNLDGIGDEAEIAASVPSYSDIDSEFEFAGWYLENEFTTAMVDFSTYKLDSDVIFYARWIDGLVGTDGLVYEVYEYEDDGVTPKNYEVVGFECTLADYSYVYMNIPAYYEEKPVVSIADHAFSDTSKLVYIKSVSLPSTIINIGDNAFIACSVIDTITIPSAGGELFKVEDGILFSADGSELYLYPAMRTIGGQKVTSYEVPASVKKIAGGAFASNKDIETITFANGSVLTEIGDNAFDGCTALKSISLPDSLEVIGNDAFRACYALQTITASETLSELQDVGSGALDDTAWFNNKLATEEFISLGRALIKYNGTAEEVIVDSRYVAVADYAFAVDSEQGAPALQIKSIIFDTNSNLERIGDNAFIGCPSLASITIMANSKVEIEANTFRGISVDAVLYVPTQLVADYADDANVSGYFTYSDNVNENTIVGR